jgi:hypothetical protein
MPDYTIYKGFFRLKWFNKFTLYLAYGLQLTREIDLGVCLAYLSGDPVRYITLLEGARDEQSIYPHRA